MHIKLGRKVSDMAMPTMSSMDKESMHYPTLYIDDIPEELPESGEITLKFKKVSDTQRNREGNRTRSVELEIHEICDVKKSSGEKKKTDRDESEAALDEAAKEYENED